jgi:hypothetical protein
MELKDLLGNSVQPGDHVIYIFKRHNTSSVLAFGEVVSVAKNTAMVTPTLVPGYELPAWEKTPKRIGSARLHKVVSTSPKTKDLDELVREWHDLTDQEMALLGFPQLHEYLGMTWAQYGRWVENGLVVA